MGPKDATRAAGAGLLALSLLIGGCGEEQPPVTPHDEGRKPDTRPAPPATEPATAPGRREDGGARTRPAAGAPRSRPEPAPSPADGGEAGEPAATEPATRPASTRPATGEGPAFDAALAEVLALERRLRFGEALERLGDVRDRFDAPEREKRLAEIAQRLRKGRRQAPQLRYALRRMARSEGFHTSVAGEQLLRAGEIGRVFLRYAVRHEPVPAAGKAAKLLAQSKDRRAVPAFVDRLMDDGDPELADQLVAGLRDLAGALEPEQAKRLYRGLRGEEQRFARRRLASVLLAYREKACDGDAETLNERLADERAAAFLEEYMKNARQADRAAVRRWAFERTAVFREPFSRYAHGTGAAEMVGWREGPDCNACAVDAKRFADTDRGHVLAMDLRGNAEDDWQKGLLRDLAAPLSGRMTFELKYWETHANHDGNLWLADEDGEPLIGVGTENPQWEVVIRGSGEVVNDGAQGDSYRHWIHVVLEIDTEKDRARVTFDDLADESRKRYGWFDLPAVEGISRIGIGPDATWYVDEIRGYPGPPR